MILHDKIDVFGIWFSIQGTAGAVRGGQEAAYEQKLHVVLNSMRFYF